MPALRLADGRSAAGPGLRKYGTLSSEEVIMMFSIVIPTRARADTLRHALRTVLAQTDRDFEVIVHESGDDPATAAAVAEFDDQRIRFFKTIEPVRMTENWERALRHARGDFVLVIGDDDGLLPDACAIARSILKTRPVDVLSWFPAFYLWPRYIDPEIANKLTATCGLKLTCTSKSSRSVLDLMYRIRLDHGKFPMIYNSFVSRKLIEHVRGSRGRYFLGSAPDVTSAVVNLCFSDHFLYCNRPLSIGGVSHHSTGTALLRSGNPALRANALAAAFGELQVHPTMVESADSTLATANELLIAKQELFPHDDPQFGYAEMLAEAAQRINEIPEQYDAVLADCRAIAERNAIEFDESDLPPRLPRPKSQKTPHQNLREIHFDFLCLDIDGASLAVENVFDASVLLAAQLPPVNAPKFAADPAQIHPLAFRDDDSVAFDFTLRGNGAHILRRGWSYIEAWGVRSLGARSELAFPIDAMFSGSLTIQLIGILFSPPRAMNVRVKIGSRTLLEHEVRATETSVDVELSPIEVRMSEGSRQQLDIIIGINRCKTPPEASVGPDQRQLEFALQRIVISRVTGVPCDSTETKWRSTFSAIFHLIRRVGAAFYGKFNKRYQR